MTWVRGPSEISETAERFARAGRFARDGCFHNVRPATLARWTAWRLAHPGWHAPLAAAAACGKLAVLAGTLAAVVAGAGAAWPHRAPRPEPEFARGGTLARFTSAPPGGSRAVGGTFVPDPDSLADARESQQDLRLALAVPEPASLAGLAVGALLAIWARKVRKIKSVRR